MTEHDFNRRARAAGEDVQWMRRRQADPDGAR